MFGERLREVRKERGIKLKDVANFLQVSITTYTRYEIGIRKPSLKKLVALCKYYDVKANYLLGLED